MKKHPFLLVFYFVTIFSSQLAFAQDSLKVHTFIPKKNILRYNITPHVFGFKSAIFGYERVVKPYQTFSINAGFIGIGKNGKSENEDYSITKTKENGGYTVALDYRFYLRRENIDSAPRGVYIGPYYSFYNFNRTNQIQRKTDDGSADQSEIDTNFKINSLGVELGYQFIIKNRFTIDMVFIGPSFSSYKLNMSLIGDLGLGDHELNEKLEAVREILYSKYPWMQTFADEKELNYKGKSTHWGLGFRYVVQVGYRF